MRYRGALCRSFIVLLLLATQALARPWVVAHRGGTELGPENTLSTFRRALAIHVDGIELDIHQSLDGELFVIHDATLNRTYGRPGKVEEMKDEDLKEAGLPTLNSVLSLVGRRAHLVIEIKEPTPGIEEHLLKNLKAHHQTHYVVVISFHQSCLKRLHELKPGLATGYLFGKEKKSPKQLKEELGVTYLGPHYSQVSEEWMNEAHQAGLKVNPWTVDDESVMRNLLDWGTDAITTNKPTLLQDLLSRRSHQEPQPATHSN